ncbi:hypothetical protein EGW08_009638 [Elysia chlorotica]|uniref:Uncharacterized protein n=1 Tax=Elysia chlorotica TaxID=188477 RepID=A0A433TLZ9_ELYCH|nr:hypothetical protein EGW08_009638 [Elysia chlorotica]
MNAKNNEKGRKTDDSDADKPPPTGYSDRENEDVHDYTGEGGNDWEDDEFNQMELEPNWGALFSHAQSSQSKKDTEVDTRTSEQPKDRKYKKKDKEKSSGVPQITGKKGHNKTPAPSSSGVKMFSNQESVEKQKGTVPVSNRKSSDPGKCNARATASVISDESQAKSTETLQDNNPPISGACAGHCPKISYLFHDAKAAEMLTRKCLTPKMPEDGALSNTKTYLKKLLTTPQPSQLARETPWLVNDKDAPRQDKLAKYKFFASSRLRYKARTMIGATGSRHFNQKRRSSLASGTTLPLTLVHNLEHINEGEEERMAQVQRRRVVDNTDLRTMAILQSRLKELKTYPE